MKRRSFLRNTGLALGTAVVTPSSVSHLAAESSTGSSILDTWDKVRSDFDLDYSYIQMAQMLLASHPSRVRDAIEKHRKNLQINPAIYWEKERFGLEKAVMESAAKYMGVESSELAFTDSTTQGMALLLNGFKLKEGDEILSTTHDHYITDKSIDYACQKTGASVKRVSEYADPRKVSVDEVVNNISKSIGDRTRLVVVTWVQSCTGVKLPIRAISEEIHRINNQRDAKDRVYFMVDGVHGFGNQADNISDLGCDYFAAGTHKWIFGPRGTGLVWARKDAWNMIEPTVPAFKMSPYFEWLGLPTNSKATFNEMFTPGGFHAFEHRWALNEAFEFQMAIGKDTIHERTTELNTMLKDAINEMPHIDLVTPVDTSLSAGINCFIADGYNAKATVDHFHHNKIIASSSPYRISYARLTPCIINTENEVEQCIKVLSDMKT